MLCWCFTLERRNAVVPRKVKLASVVLGSGDAWIREQRCQPTLALRSQPIEAGGCSQSVLSLDVRESNKVKVVEGSAGWCRLQGIGRRLGGRRVGGDGDGDVRAREATAGRGRKAREEGKKEAKGKEGSTADSATHQRLKAVPVPARLRCGGSVPGLEDLGLAGQTLHTKRTKEGPTPTPKRKAVQSEVVIA